MLVTEQMVNGILFLTLSGRFGKSCDLALENALIRGKNQQIKRIVFNMENISSIDTNGIGIIFFTYYYLEQRGIQLILVNPKPEVRKVLDLVNIPQVMAICCSNEEVMNPQPLQGRKGTRASKKKVTHKSECETASSLFLAPSFGWA